MGWPLPPTPAGLLGQEPIPRKLRKLLTPAEGTSTVPRAGLWARPRAGGTGGPQPPLCCCCDTEDLPRDVPGALPAPRDVPWWEEAFSSEEGRVDGQKGHPQCG